MSFWPQAPVVRQGKTGHTTEHWPDEALGV